MVLNSRFFKRLLLAYGILVFLFTVFYILSCTFHVIPISEASEYVLAFVSPVIYSLLCILALIVYNKVKTEKSNAKENLYNLGKPMTFFSYAMFENRVKYLEKTHRKNKESFITVFSVSQSTVVQTFGRNKVITQFMGDVAVFIRDFVMGKTEITPKDCCFCFYHGMFVFYCFTDEAKVRHFVDVFNDAIFDIAKKKDFRLYVQPIFGVAKVDRENDSLKMALDNASASRNLAERRFEKVIFYNPNDVRTISVSETDEILDALNKKEFVVYYQPKYSLKKKEFVGAEALVRWDSKVYGLVPPSKFIEKAEAAGLIHEIDEYVFKRVCADLSEAKRRGRRLIPVSVNFSMYEFFDADFVSNMIKTCEECNIPTSLIEVEVTESSSQANSFMAKLVISRLKEKGFRILMDDFGTGFSNLENLMKFQFDALKLDRSYIIRIVNDVKSREIVKLLIDLAAVNGMEVIAEGVDNQSQVEILRRSGCDTIQGFYYSTPLSKIDYEKFIAEGGNPFEKKKREATK